MADDLNKKALLEIDLDVNALNEQAATAKQKVADLATQMKALAAAGQQNTAAYIQLAGQQKSYNQVVTTALNVNKQLTTSQNSNTGSITELRSQLSLVTAQYNSLSVEQRANVAVGSQLLLQQKNLSGSLKTLEAAGGNTTRSVGDYEQSIKNALATMNPFASELSTVVQGYNSLVAAVAASTEQQAVKAAADEIALAASAQLTAATEALTTAQAAQAVAEAEAAELQATNAASAEALSAANIQLTETTAALAAAQEVQAAASTASATANVGAAAASEVAATGFKLFDTILKASIIGAIAGIILLLIGYLKTFKPVVDLVSKAFAAASAAVEYLINGLINAIAAFKDIGNVISNLADFFEHPIDSIGKFTQGMADAAKASYDLKQAQIDLENQMKSSDVQTAASAQKVSALILAARNRSLSNDQRQTLLKQAAALDQADYDRRKSLSDKEVANAIQAANIEGQLTQQQLDLVKKVGVAALVQLQNDGTIRGKITDQTIDDLKKAQLNAIALLQESTNTQEKIQNRADQSADRAEKAEEARQQKLKELRDKAQKQDDARVQAEEKTRELQETGRAAELAKINVDYDKRVDAARGYSATINAINAERVAALAKQNHQYFLDDQKQQAENNLQSASSKVSALEDENKKIESLKGAFSDREQDTIQNNLKKIHDINAEAIADQQSYELSQANLTGEQLTAIDQKYQQQKIANDQKFHDDSLAISKDLGAKNLQFQTEQLAATQAIEQSKRDIMAQSLDILTQTFSKQTVLGKLAFVAQKVLAAAEIFIQTQKQVAAIELAAAYESANAALELGYFASIPAIAIIEGTAAVKVSLAEVSGAVAIAGIAAQAISGFSTGGVYESDGRGGLLPGYSKHDNINSKLRSGEGIIVSEAMQNPGARSVVSAINVAYGGRPFDAVSHGAAFASGGLFNPDLQFSNDYTQMQHVIKQTAAAIAQNTPRQVLVIQDVQLALGDNESQQVRSTI